MADSFSVSIDLSDLNQVGAILRQGLFQNLEDAVRSVALTGVERWQRAVQAAPLWQGERDAYAASITAEQVGPLAWEIRSTYKYVEDIETGRPAYDLKQMLNTSMKVRVSKQGRRYLIIPFQHNTPGNSALAAPMPKDVYDQAKKLKPSSITGHYSRRSGTGAWDIQTREPARVRARKYLWGGRLGSNTAPKLRAYHKSDPFAGMIRFDTTKPSGQRQSAYLTFRVMVEGQSGWVIGPRPGQWIAQHVAASLQRTAAQDMGAVIAAA